MSSPPPMAPMAPPPPPPTPSGRRGCVIAAVIVLLLLLVACVGGGYACVTHAGAFMAMGMTSTRPQAEKALASDVPSELRDELWAEWDAFTAYIKGWNALSPAPGTDPNKLMVPIQQLQPYIADGSFTAEEVRAFIAACRDARGAKPE